MNEEQNKVKEIGKRKKGRKDRREKKEEGKKVIDE